MRRVKHYAACLLILAGRLSVAADDARPVVQILGRSDAGRPSLTTVQAQPANSAAQHAEAPTPAVSPAQAITLPVGSIVAWANAISNMPALPRGWAACNGQAVEDVESPLLGQQLPDLNGAGGGSEGRFLRGAASSGGVGGSATHVHGAFRAQKDGTHRVPVAAPTKENTLPPYYNVVWIIRIK